MQDQSAGIHSRVPAVSAVRGKTAPVLIGANHLYDIKGNFSRPMGISVDNEGIIYIADSGKSVIHILNREGKLRESIGRFGWRAGEFDNPVDVALDPQLRLYIADSGNSRIQMYSLVSRRFSVIVGEKSNSSSEALNLSQPQGVATDVRGYVYIADTWNHRILKVDPLGRLKMEIGDQQLRNPYGVAVDFTENIYISDSGNHRIYKLDFSGSIMATWGEEGIAKAQFQNPSGLTIDDFGYVYVVDKNNHRIQIFNPEGNYITEFGQPFLEDPVDIAVDDEYYAYVTDISAGDIKVFKIITR